MDQYIYDIDSWLYGGRWTREDVEQVMANFGLSEEEAEDWVGVFKYLDRIYG